jgi:hypothetical protein
MGLEGWRDKGHIIVKEKSKGKGSLTKLRGLSKIKLRSKAERELGTEVDATGTGSNPMEVLSS